MAHFAKLDENNIVIDVIVINNLDIIDENTGEEKEELGIDVCKKIYGQNTKWKQTSYNSNFRHYYAGIGYSYDENLDAFIPPQPFSSWSFDQENMRWNAPIPKPEDDKMYIWNEAQQTWISFL